MTRARIDAAYERGMQEGLDLRDDLRDEIAQLREQLGDREQDEKIALAEVERLRMAAAELVRVLGEGGYTIPAKPFYDLKAALRAERGGIR